MTHTPTRAELQAELLNFAERAQFARERIMITGRIDLSGDVTMTGAPDGKSWVRSAPDSRDETAVWKAWTGANDWVRVRPNAQGELEIVGPAFSTGSVAGGNGFESGGIPPLNGLKNRAEWYEHNVRPFRLERALEGGLYVRIRTYNALGMPDTVYLCTVPGAAGKQAWCLIYFDPRTRIFGQITGSLHEAAEYLTEDLIYSECPLPVGLYPIGAVRLANGQTEIANTDFGNFKMLWGDKLPLCNYAAAAAPTTGDDSVDGYSVGSWWFDTTNDRAYVCIDPTASAAIWANTQAGGAVEVQSNSVTVESATTLFNFGPEFVIGNPASGEVTVSAPTGGATLWAEVLIYDKTLAAAGTFDTNTADDSGRTGIGGYTDLRAQIVGKSSTAAEQYLRPVFNADTTVTNYKTQMMYATGTGGGNVSRYYFNSNTVMGVAMSTSGKMSVIEMTIRGYSNTSDYKMARFTEARLSAATVWETTQPVFWLNTAAITRLQFSVDSVTNFATGARLQVWGRKEVSVGMPTLSNMAVAGALPTAAELNAEFPGAVNGFAAYINDSGADTDFFHVWRQGGNWIAVEGTKL